MQISRTYCLSVTRGYGNIKGCDLTYALRVYSGVTVLELHRTSLI